MKYKLVIFDMDGTFMHSILYHIEVFYLFLNKYHKSLTRDDIKDGMGDTVRNIFENVGVPKDKMEEMFYKLDSFVRNEVDVGLYELTRKNDGIEELCAGLRQMGAKLAVVTNSMQVVAEKMIEYNGLTSLFDTIVGADFHSVDKLGRCRKTVEDYGADMKQTLYIGDAERDMQIAREMGCDLCFAKTKIAWYKDAERIEREYAPEYTVTELVQLPAMLEDMT